MNSFPLVLNQNPNSQTRQTNCKLNELVLNESSYELDEFEFKEKEISFNIRKLRRLKEL